MGQTLGGYPYPIMLCNISQNAMGQTPRAGTLPGPAGGGGILPDPARGVPCQWGTLPGGTLLRRVPCWGSTQVGYLPHPGQDGGRGVPCLGEYPAGGTLSGGYPGRVPPARSGWGYPARRGTLLGGYPGRVPSGQVRMGGTLPGGTQVGYPPSQVRMGGRVPS